MTKRRDDHDDQPPARPAEPSEDGDVLTPEDEAALDAAVAEIPDEVKRASDEWVQSWAKTLEKQEGEHGK